MSIDLDWSKLDSALSSSLVDALNKQLASTQRPSFIGPVEVISLDFGTTGPDVELVDLREIHGDFLEDDETEEENNGFVKVTEVVEDDGPIPVPQRHMRSHSHGRIADELWPSYHHLPPHIRYGRGPADMYASMPGLHPSRDYWTGGAESQSVADFRSALDSSSGYRRGGLRSPSPAPFNPLFSLHSNPPSRPVSPRPVTPDHRKSQSLEEPKPTEPSEADDLPNLQVHLHIIWHSNLRITLTTSLLINYPSPSFMSLPIKLSVTGLIFDGEVAIAYEGARQRVHLCVLDDLDPYGPAGDRPKREREPETPIVPDMDDESPGAAYSSKPLPIGQRLLPSIFIESEIGQADKHVLKNVTRVERFIQDVIRKTVEEELVFPNFHTVLLGAKN